MTHTVVCLLYWWLRSYFMTSQWGKLLHFKGFKSFFFFFFLPLLMTSPVLSEGKKHTYQHWFPLAFTLKNQPMWNLLVSGFRPVTGGSYVHHERHPVYFYSQDMTHSTLTLVPALCQCYYCYCAARWAGWGSLSVTGGAVLTQADVVMEKGQEVVALFPLVAAGCAGAPGSNVGCGVVKVVGSYCASCRREINRILSEYSLLMRLSACGPVSQSKCSSCNHFIKGVALKEKLDESLIGRF